MLSNYKTIKAWALHAVLDLFALASGLVTKNRTLATPRALFLATQLEAHANKSDRALAAML